MTSARVPPHDRDAERALLGAMLLAPAAVDAAVTVVDADDFYVPAHGHIYTAAVALHSAGEAVDAITVGERLAATGTPNVTVADLAGLSFDAPSTSSAGRYARIVAGHATRRRLISVAGELADRGYDLAADLDETLQTAATDLDHVTAGRQPGNRPVPLADALAGWLDTEEEHQRTGGTEAGPAISTGIADLDHKLGGGFRPGQLIIAAARPSMGKSAFAIQVGVAAAIAGQPVLFASLEMGVAEITERILGSAARVDLQRIRTHGLLPNDWPKLAHAVKTLSPAPLHLYDDATATLAAIRAEGRRLRGLGMVIVDYLALVNRPAGQRHEGRQFEVAEIARGLKTLARELHVPVVAAAQINRGVEQRISDRRPLLSDLRDSGEVEAAADVVIGLYRDDYYNPESADRGIAELIVLKQRNGPTGTVKVAWLEHHGRFELMRRD